MGPGGMNEHSLLENVLVGMNLHYCPGSTGVIGHSILPLSTRDTGCGRPGCSWGLAPLHLEAGTHRDTFGTSGPYEGRCEA